MLNYDGLQDVLTAALVVVVVAVVVAAAWLSTNVREQPLVATAVVVFHSGGTVEGGSGGGGGSGDMSVVETQGGGGEAAAAPAEEKDGEATSCPREEGMEVKAVPQETSPDRTQESGEAEEQQVNASVMEAAESQGESGPGRAVAGVRSDEGQCIGPSSEGSPRGGPNDGPYPPQPDCTREEGPEMEVRRRRLQHFVSMGGAAASTVEEICIPTLEKAEEASSKEGPAIGEDRLASTPAAATHTDIPTSHTKEEQQQEKEGGTEVEKKEEEAENTAQGKEETRPPGSIKIRLKFLDETQRYVFAQLTEKVGTFKRQHFSIELDANRRIRLIFNGQLLSRDSSTLAQYGLFDNCVVHCHVSQPQLLPLTPGRSGEAAAQEEEDAYVSRLLAPLLYAVMVVMWYLRYEYGHLFNTMSTIILLFLTALLLISTYLLYITQHVPQGSAATTHIPVTGRTIAHTPSSSVASTASSPSTSS